MITSATPALPACTAQVLPAEEEAVPSLRRFVRDAVHDRVAPEVEDDALLAVTELATNAVRHSQSPRVRVEIGVRASRLLLTVHDEGAWRPPKPREEQPADDGLATGGRGLQIVADLPTTLRSGHYHPHAGGTVAWVLFSLSPIGAER